MTDPKPSVETWYCLVSDYTEFHEAKPGEYLRQMQDDVAKRNATVLKNTGRHGFWEIVEVEVQLPRFRAQLGD